MRESDTVVQGEPDVEMVLERDCVRLPERDGLAVKDSEAVVHLETVGDSERVPELQSL